MYAQALPYQGVVPISITTHKEKLNQIIEASFKYNNVDPALKSAKTKKEDIVSAKHLAIYLAIKHLKFSSFTLGKVFNLDRSSVSITWKNFRSTVSENPFLKSEISRLEKELNLI